MLVANPDQQDTSGNGTGDVCNDEDLDGLLDSAETNTGVFVGASDTGTDPLAEDTDGDGLPDGLEVLDYGSNPLSGDTDGDTWGDAVDNCILVANLDQADRNASADDDPLREGTQHYGDLCDGDLNDDGAVDTADFFGFFRPCFAVVVADQPACALADLDSSGAVNTADFFAYFLPQFGGPPGPGVETNEPAVSFTGLGDLPGGLFRSHAASVADEALVVVGWSDSALGNEAFRWEDGVMTGLGDFTPGSADSYASDVSADGQVVVGSGVSALGREAYRWTGGVMTPIGDIPGGAHVSAATAVSADGSVIVGSGRATTIFQRGFRWTGGVLSDLGAPSGPESPLRGITADGSTGVGEGNAFGNWGAWQWSTTAGWTFLPWATPQSAHVWAAAENISDDARVVVGGSGVTLGTSRAVRWVDTVPEILPSAPGQTGRSHARGVSADGNIVVGWVQTSLGMQAMIWEVGGTTRLLQDVLTSDYGLDLTGWTLTEASHISANGSKVVGVGTNPGGNQEGWLAVLPATASATKAASQSSEAETSSHATDSIADAAATAGPAASTSWRLSEGHLPGGASTAACTENCEGSSAPSAQDTCPDGRCQHAPEAAIAVPSGSALARGLLVLALLGVGRLSRRLGG